jgi:hypothetical protein
MRKPLLAAALGLLLAALLPGLARADCLPVFFGGNGTIQRDTCGPVIFTGTVAATLTLPVSGSWKGSVINQGTATLSLIGGNGAPVNGGGAGIQLSAGVGGVVSGDPSQGWWAVVGGGGGSGAATVFVGASTGTNTYLLAPTPGGYVLGNQTSIVTTFANTNTGAATENVNSTGALPIVTNTASGLAALVGGELVAGLEYQLVYSTSAAATCAASCYVAAVLPQGAVVAGTTQTVTAAQWAFCTIFAVTTTSQTLTLPASSGLSANGCIVVVTAQSVTLQANAADAINGGSAGGSVTIASGVSSIVLKSSAGNITAQPTTSGGGTTAQRPKLIATHWYNALTWAAYATGNAFASTTTAYCYPFQADQTATIETLGAKVQTAGGGGGTAQFALYSENNGRPNALLTNTGSASDISGGSVASAALSPNYQLVAGTIYWLCAEASDTTVKFYTFSGSASAAAGWSMGSTSSANIFPGSSIVSIFTTTGITSYGTWPSFASASWTEEAGASVAPIIGYQVLSVP